MESNKFKELFDEADFKMANKFGKLFIDKLEEAFPQIEIVENESQARTDVFEGTPGFEDGCDIVASIQNLKLFFEITGDGKYLAKSSKFLPFNKFAVNKLLKQQGYGFAVYYLGKEDPPLFFIQSASIIDKKYEASSIRKTVRGDTGVKYKIPLSGWVTFDEFVQKLKSKIGQ